MMAHISSVSSTIEHSVNAATRVEAQRSTRTISSHISQVLDDSTAAVRGDLNELKLSTESRVHRDRLLGSLTFVGMNERRQQAKESFPNTFQWAFRGDLNKDGGDENDGAHKSHWTDHTHYIKWDSFEDWLRSGTQVYWISGKPGSGKTTLVKYLLSDTRTRDALDVWNHGSVVLSHFFWRPGTPMQQNIKGLLCNLLYQILEVDAALIENMTSHFPETRHKSMHTDWSVSELTRVFLALLKGSEKPICIFLDGLDEVDPDDGIFDLFEVIDNIRHTPRTKLCLSSRPEPPIRKRLTDYPQLRLQDLTLGDTWTYAKGMLKFPSFRSGDKHRMARDMILRDLVEKAEGVFLWLCLAVKTLNAGLDNGDSLEEVVCRANGLPTSLVDLYKDIWSRANRYHAVYRQEAALYFKTVLASKTPFPGSLSLYCMTQPDISVFEMALARSTAESRLQNDLIPAEKLYNLCSETERRIQTRCAGLLEIGKSGKISKSYGVGCLRRPGYDELLQFADGSMTIKFIHRSAFDFLRDTAEGQDILSNDTTSERSIYTNIFKACLSSRYLLCPVSVRPPCLEAYISELGQIWNLPGSHDTSHQLLLYETAAFLEHAGSSGHLKLYWQCRHKSSTPENHEFLVYAARHGLNEFVMTTSAKRNISGQLKSDILLSTTLSALSFPILGHSHEYFELAQYLLSQGADPNCRGFAVPCQGYQTVLKTTSPFSTFLEQLAGLDFQDYDLKINPHKILHAMHNFLTHGANTSGQVNLNLYILPHDQIGLVPLEALFTWRLGTGNISTWRRKRWFNSKRDDEEQPDAKFCILLVPAYVLISIFIDRFERRMSSNKFCKADCCGVDHVAPIKRTIALADHDTEPQVIALPQGSLNGVKLPFRSVTKDDSAYLSNAVIGFLSGPCMAYDKRMFVKKYLEVYERSERHADFEALVEAQGLAHSPDWDNNNTSGGIIQSQMTFRLRS